MKNTINLESFQRFIKSASGSGVILITCVVLSLIVANSSAFHFLDRLLSVELGIEVSQINLRFPVLLWINDGLMAIFFLYVGLEIKREMVEGELSSFNQAALPVLAALGGVLVPALIYFLFNHSDPITSKGWGIPMATDIAFAIGIVSLLGKSVPSSLKIFLSALAIVDDLMAILVIAFFYSTHVDVIYLLYAAVILVILIVFNRFGVTNLFFYLVPGAIIWYLIHHSGVHATIAGVLTAITIPTNQTSEPSPLEKLEHRLSLPVSFVILPLFAFVNTNIRFVDGMEDGLLSSMGLGIVFGLVIGKPVGIFLSCYMAIKSRACKLPSFATWKHMLGAGMLGGIGFTMSIFVAILSFNDTLLQSKAKFSILCASIIAGLCGFLFLKMKTSAITVEQSELESNLHEPSSIVS